MSEKSETPTMPEPNKLCPILMIIPPKTGTYGDIVCLGERCEMRRVSYVYDGNYVGQEDGYCGLAGKP